MQAVQRINTVSQRPVRAASLWGSQRCGGVALMMGVLQCKDTDFLGRTGWGDEERELGFM